MNKYAIPILLLAFAGTTAAQAENCRLVPRAVLEFRKGAGGDLTIPVTISGKTYQFAIALGSAHSAVAPELVDALHLARRDMPAAITIRLGGEKVRDRVTLPDIQIGGAIGRDFEMLELPWPESGGVAGFIGMDVLSGYDLELDLKANAMRLFAQDHCAGQVVYWTTNYGLMPLAKDPEGAFHLDGKLDGKTVTVSFELWQDEGSMGMSDARDLFGFTKDDPRLSPAGDAKDPDKRSFRYPFATLALGDLAIGNPQITLYPQAPAQQCRIAPKGVLHPEPEAYASYYGPVCFGATSLTLGRGVMQQLRLYFAFKEGNLYLTPASAGNGGGAGR